MRDAYTLEFPAVNITERNNDTAPEVLLACSVIYAFAVSCGSLITAMILPAICLITRKADLKALVKLNMINAVMIITIALTWPVFSDGIITGSVIALRVNMIYIVFASLVFPMGIAKIYSALYWLPEKLRILIILTLRGIYILHERIDTAITAVKLRAPELKGNMKLKVIAYIFASVLLQGADRSERMMLAIECRGGFAGFTQSEHSGLTGRDITICVVFSVYIIAVLFFSSPVQRGLGGLEVTPLNLPLSWETSNLSLS